MFIPVYARRFVPAVERSPRATEGWDESRAPVREVRRTFDGTFDGTFDEVRDGAYVRQPDGSYALAACSGSYPCPLHGDTYEYHLR